MTNDTFWGALGVSATVLTAGLGIWLASDYKALGLALTIIGVVAVAAIFIARKRAPSGARPFGRWAPMWSVSMKMTCRDLLPLRRLIPLGEAATIAYEKTKGTTARLLAEQITKGKPLAYFHRALTDDSALYGARPPSRVIEPIDPRDLKSGVFSDDGSTFREFPANQPTHDQLHILRRDLRRYIRWARNTGGVGPRA